MEPRTDRLPISVVIPAFNRETLLAAALQSVFAQTQLPAEVIVVDDGSTDRTADVAQSAGATVIRQRNAGVSAARNAGITGATQPWIAFLDSDDAWLPEKLALQWQAIQLCPQAGVVITDFAKTDASGVLLNKTLPTFKAYRSIKRTQVAPDIYCLDFAGARDAMVFQYYVQTSTLVIRRDVLERVGMFDTGLRQREDHDVLLRVLTVASAAAVERTLSFYRLAGPLSLTDEEEGIAMLRARSHLADRVHRAPAKYPPAAVEEYGKRQPLWLRRLGVRSLMAGDFDGAVDAFRQSLARRFSMQALIWSGASRAARTLGGRHAYRSAQSLWRLLRGRRNA